MSLGRIFQHATGLNICRVDGKEIVENKLGKTEDALRVTKISAWAVEEIYLSLNFYSAIS